MSVWSLVSKSIDETTQIASSLGSNVKAKDAILLSGVLGAGKTTFVQGIAKGMKICEPVFSPTFIMARKYKSFNALPDLLHVDAYRMSSALTCEDLGIEDAIETAVCVVEWGNLIKNLLLALEFNRVLEIQIEVDVSNYDSIDDSRSIVFTSLRGDWLDTQKEML